MATPVELWIQALRSGEYEQGKNTLCSVSSGKPRHCCLGVLCEVYQKEVGGLHIVESDGFRWYSAEGAFPPSKVAEWAGLNVGKYAKVPFTQMNDVENKTFNEIADFIERIERGENTSTVMG